MFNVDRKTLNRIARQIERVLIVDTHAASARMLGEILKELGARQPVYATQTERALELAHELNPQVVFVDLEGPGLDGVDFTTRLRRSQLGARKAAVVILAANPREGAIKSARDAGAHEFLCKPFTAGHLYRRVENVTLKPRLWVEAKMYVGPDRRRFNSGDFVGKRKRRSDEMQSQALACAFTNAEAQLRAELDLYATLPQQALKGMLEQASELQAASFHHADPHLGAVVSSLLTYLLSAVDEGVVEPTVVERHMTAVRALRDTTLVLSAPERAQLLLKLSSSSEVLAA